MGGGVLDIFHPIWKLKIAENPKFFSIITQLWQAAFDNTNNENYDSHHHDINDNTTTTATAVMSSSSSSSLRTTTTNNNNSNKDYFSLPFGSFPYNRGYIY